MASLPNRAARRFAAIRTVSAVLKLVGLAVFLALVVLISEGWRP